MSSETVRWLNAKLEALFASFSGILEWKWDGRFDTALAEFSVERSEEIHAILEAYLPSCLDAAQLTVSSEAIRQIGRKLGGLMLGQKLLLSASKSNAYVFCAWWPWGSGQRISIRIGVFASDLLHEEVGALVDDLRGLIDT